MQLAPNFTLSELTRTEHRGLLDRNADEALACTPSLKAVADMLQVVRDHFGMPLVVHSGFRCKALNEAIGGAKGSQHVKGEAADFHVHSTRLEDVFDWIWKESGLAYGQIILEGVQAGQPTWIHLSLGEPWRDRAKCRQALAWSKAAGYVRVDAESA